MKLIMESWRDWVGLGKKAEPEEEVIESGVQDEDKLIFYEWLVSDLKDQAFIKWIEIHQERAKWVAPRNAWVEPYDRAVMMRPIELKRPRDACKLDLSKIPWGTGMLDHEKRSYATVSLSGPSVKMIKDKFWQEGKKLTEQFNAAYEEIEEHLAEIKFKFPYDVFAGLDCKQKMEHLDQLVELVIICPYPPDHSGPLSEILSTKNLQNKPTPYEACIIEFKQQHDAAAEVERVAGGLDLQEDKT